MYSLKRNPSIFETRPYDVVVIGGGIHGAGIAWDATLRGLRTCLIEKGDFGSGSSAGCFKIVHGGLRYLQHLNIKRLRESVREQRILRQIAPHLVHPLPFLVPCYGAAMRGKVVLSAGMALYEMLAADRNTDVSPEHLLPRYQRIGRDEVLRIAPGLNSNGLKGGVVYYDCQMSNCDRLTFSVVLAAAQAGADVCNYIEAVDVEQTDVAGDISVIDAVIARDFLGGDQLRIQTKYVVNAAGPWIADVICRAKVKKVLNANDRMFSKGVQIVVPEIIKSYAVAVESQFHDKGAVLARGGRSYFFQPWRGCTLIGTTDTVFKQDPDSFGITNEDIDSFVADVKTLYESDVLQLDSVRHAFGGLRPIDPLELAKHNKSGDVLASREGRLLDHSQKQNNGQNGEKRIKNLLSVIGVKYTTFRAFAEKAVDIVSHKLERGSSACRTAETPLPGGDFSSQASLERELTKQVAGEMPEATIIRLVNEYGTTARELVKQVQQRPNLAAKLSDETDIRKVEIAHAVDHEMAVTLEDIVMRRTGLGTLGDPGATALETCQQAVQDSCDCKNDLVVSWPSPAS